jgi:hypothetical protein
MRGASKNLTTRNWKLKSNFGKEVWAEYKYGNTAITNFAAIGKDIKTFTLNIAVMTNAIDGACVDTNHIARNIRVTQERFAQANANVATNSVTYFCAPQSVATNLNGWVMNTSTNNNVWSPEALAIFKAANPTGALTLIYMPSLRFWENGTIIPLRGAASPGIPSIFISGDDETPFTPPHELGHYFGLPHVIQENRNLMRDGGTSDVNGILESKRLAPQQIETIRSQIP